MPYFWRKKFNDGAARNTRSDNIDKIILYPRPEPTSSMLGCRNRIGAHHHLQLNLGTLVQGTATALRSELTS